MYARRRLGEMTAVVDEGRCGRTVASVGGRVYADGSIWCAGWRLASSQGRQMAEGRGRRRNAVGGKAGESSPAGVAKEGARVPGGRLGVGKPGPARAEKVWCAQDATRLQEARWWGKRLKDPEGGRSAAGGARWREEVLPSSLRGPGGPNAATREVLPRQEGGTQTRLRRGTVRVPPGPRRQARRTKRSGRQAGRSVGRLGHLGISLPE